MINPGMLKLELFCKGIKIDPSCTLDADARDILRSRGGLGSGLEAILPGSLYINIPVEEHFAKSSPYTLCKEEGGYVIKKSGGKVCNVSLPPRPKFYTQKTSSGKLMSRIGVMQGTYLGIYPTQVCSFWQMKPKMNCQFCSVGLNLGRTEELEKSVSDVIETVKAAQTEEKITFVHFNTGFYHGKELDELEPYIRAVKKETGLLIGVQTPPAPDLEKYNYLKDLGVDHVSFCLELFNEQKLGQICPGKDKFIGRQRFLDAIAYCAKLFGKGKVAGEIIVGLEPIEDTIKAIEYFGKLGAVSTICVFRPCLGTKLEQLKPPRPEETAPVFKRMYEVCVENHIPIDIAPNIKVSLVLLPYEGRYFVANTLKQKRYDLEMNLYKTVFYAYFKTKLTIKRLSL